MKKQRQIEAIALSESCDYEVAAFFNKLTIVTIKAPKVKEPKWNLFSL